MSGILALEACLECSSFDVQCHTANSSSHPTCIVRGFQLCFAVLVGLYLCVCHTIIVRVNQPVVTLVGGTKCLNKIASFLGLLQLCN